MKKCEITIIHAYEEFSYKIYMPIENLIYQILFSMFKVNKLYQ